MDAPVDRFAGIDAFVATARAGGFTAAAEVLGLTPSGVAKSVTRLEARIGLKLLHRTTRRLTLTPEGEAYLAACTRAIDELEAAESGLAPKDWVPQGHIHLGAAGLVLCVKQGLKVGVGHPRIIRAAGIPHV